MWHRKLTGGVLLLVACGTDAFLPSMLGPQHSRLRQVTSSSPRRPARQATCFSPRRYALLDKCSPRLRVRMQEKPDEDSAHHGSDHVTKHREKFSFAAMSRWTEENWKLASFVTRMAALAPCCICRGGGSEAVKACLEATGNKQMAVDIPEILSIVIFSGGAFILQFLLYELSIAQKKLNEVKNDFSYTELAQYRLDHYFSTSKWAKPLLLLGATLLLICVGAVLLYAAEGGKSDMAAELWTAWKYVADQGAHTDTKGTLVRLVSLGITIGGMLVFALMIGIISESIGEKVDELKKGKSRVIESGHTLLLGWNDKALAIIQEISHANESEGGGVIVVLSESDKQEMEEILEAACDSREHGLELLGTEVVFRCGNPLAEHELLKVAVRQAKSIICLSQDSADSSEADSRMVRQVLSLKGIGDIAAHIVVEMQDSDNKELITLIAPEMVEVITAHDVIGRLMIQCARSPGLAYVLEQMMGFVGNEFYFRNWPQLEGLTFRSILCRFNDAVPVGIKRARDGKIKINPSDDTVIEEGDEILVLAQDNDSYTVNDGSYPLQVARCDDVSCWLGQPSVPDMEKLLFCGWRRDMADMITELDKYVAPGSELWLFNQVPATERLQMFNEFGSRSELVVKNLVIKNAVGNPIVRRDLMKLTATDVDGVTTNEVVTLDYFDSVLVLSDEAATQKNGADMESSDSRSLACLLIIQDILRKMSEERMRVSGEEPPEKSTGSAPAVEVPVEKLTPAEKLKRKMAMALNKTIKQDQKTTQEEKQAQGDTTRQSYNLNRVPDRKFEPVAPIAEILDTRTRSLLQVVDCKGYVMSNQIVSSYMSQVAECRDMNAVLGELLTAEGNEPYLRKAAEYINDDGQELSFWDIVLRARERGEVCIGYKTHDVPFLQSQETILNPPNKAEKRAWHAEDVLVVFAED